MPIRVDDMPPAILPLLDGDQWLVDQGGRGPTTGTGRVSVADARSTVGASLVTPNLAPVLALVWTPPLNTLSKVRVDLIGDDPLGSGVGSNEFTMHVICTGGGLVVVGTPYGAVAFWSGSLAAQTQLVPSAVAGTVHLTLTSAANLSINWRAQLTVQAQRSLV
jgi:hypothetical protein